MGAGASVNESSLRAMDTQGLVEALKTIGPAYAKYETVVTESGVVGSDVAGLVGEELEECLRDLGFNTLHRKVD